MVNLEGVSSVDGLVALLNPLFYAGLIGPTQGNQYFVRPQNGLDSNSGTSPAAAFQTLQRALAAATPNQNDMVILMAEGNTAGSTSLTEAMTVVNGGSPSGSVICTGARCGFIGAGKWNATSAVLYMVNGTVTAGSSGYGAHIT